MQIKKQRSRTHCARDSLRDALHDFAKTFNDTASLGNRANQSINERDMSVIRADIRRSVVFWDIHQNLKPAQRIKKRKALFEVIQAMLTTFPRFRYYQGMHDVCLVVLEVTRGDVPETIRLLKPLLTCMFEPFLSKEFDRVIPHIMDDIKREVRKQDAELDSFIEESGFDYHFAIPWILTWMSHNIESFDKVCATFETMIRERCRVRIHHVCAAFLVEGERQLRETFHMGFTRAIDELTRNVDMSAVRSRAICMSMEQPMRWFVQRKIPSRNVLPRQLLLVGAFGIILSAIAIRLLSIGSNSLAPSSREWFHRGSYWVD
jgi:hypothetical protein